MGRKGGRLTEQRLIPFEAARHVAYPYDRPRALHRVPTQAILQTKKGGILTVLPSDFARDSIAFIAAPVKHNAPPGFTFGQLMGQIPIPHKLTAEAAVPHEHGHGLEVNSSYCCAPAIEA